MREIFKKIYDLANELDFEDFYSKVKELFNDLFEIGDSNPPGDKDEK